MDSGSKLKSKIAEAGIELFRTEGYEKVSVNDICEAAGVARSSFYRVFAGKKDLIRYLFEHTDANSIVSVEELLAAENDFDRMWIIGDRYITLARQLGPELMSSIMSLALQGDIDLLSLGHSVDAWFIRLTRNCQKTGLIRSREPPELLGPLMVDMVYHAIYEWAARKGRFPVRARSRRITEALVDLAPEYRWKQERLDAADGFN